MPEMPGIIQKTIFNEKSVHMSGLEKMIVERTGLPAGTPTMEGIIANTKAGRSEKKVPELHKVAVGHVGKTKAKRMGQIPYAGPLY